jgi:hypothetical protein
MFGNNNIEKDIFGCICGVDLIEAIEINEGDEMKLR